MILIKVTWQTDDNTGQHLQSLAIFTHESLSPGLLLKVGHHHKAQASFGQEVHGYRKLHLHHSWRNPERNIVCDTLTIILRPLNNLIHPWSIMQKGKDIVGCVFAVDFPLLKEVTVALLSLIKVFLLSRQDVVKVDRYELVPVRPCVLVHEA